MSRGINKVILVGNIGQDPEIKQTPSGNATNISVATSESWRDKNTGEPKTRTEWHRVALFNRLADIAAEFLRKGSKVYVEGSLRNRKWTGDDGIERYATDIVAREMQFLDRKPENNQEVGAESYQQAKYGAVGQSPDQTHQAPVAIQRCQGGESSGSLPYGLRGDDIPF